MKKLILISILLLLQSGTVFPHPGTGILIDAFGNIYFIHTGVGIAKYSTDGLLTYVYKSNDGHWMCFDDADIFSMVQPVHFQRVSKDGEKPSIIYAEGGSPIVMGPDGNFFYCGGENGDLNPGARTIVRETPQHKLSILSPQLEDTLKKLHDGITGLAADSSGLYLACWNSLLKVDMQGKIRILAHPVIVSDCDPDPADHNETNRGIPLLRGIAVDESGTIYTAATSCHCLLRIRPNGKTETILKSERPWSPTGVTLHHGNIFVLEYTNANGPSKEGWKPRIRKIDKTGRVTLVLDLSKENNLR
jgi:hypothetical protein